MEEQPRSSRSTAVGTATGLGAGIGLMVVALFGAYGITHHIRDTTLPFPFFEMFGIGLWLMIFYAVRLAVLWALRTPSDEFEETIQSAPVLAHHLESPVFEYGIVPDGHVIYLDVLNHGVETEFMAEVKAVRGLEESLPTPWSVRWVDFGGRGQVIRPGQQRRLILAHATAVADNHDGVRQGEFRFPMVDGEDLVGHLPISTADHPSALYTKEVDLRVSVEAVGMSAHLDQIVTLGFTNDTDPGTHDLRVRATATYVS